MLHTRKIIKINNAEHLILIILKEINQSLNILLVDR